MANNLVFNEVASKLKVLVHGMDGSTTKPVKVDADGNVVVVATNLDIRNLTATDDIVTVQGINTIVGVSATDLDIRNLTATDIVTVQGINTIVGVSATDLDIRNLTSDDIVTVQGINTIVGVSATDLDIRNLSGDTDHITVDTIVNTVTVKALSITDVTTITASGSGNALTKEVAGVSEYSFYVKNLSADPVTVTIQIGPIDGVGYYQDDPAVGSVMVSQNDIVILAPSRYANFSRIAYQSGATCNFEAYYVARKA